MSSIHDISIVIVNYNVRDFVLNCLESIYKSDLQGLTLEVFVVDNASIDGSTQVIAQEYPQVQLIANEKNLGFSVANNIAIKKAAGKYVLLLNPDTLVQEDTLKKCFDYMEGHPSVGALGVKMIDGSGTFLPESKRALPSAWNSFTKLSGLANVFPQSQLFNGYALGHLSEDSNHEIEVLCGAFMFMPRSVLEKVGLLDEQFFMYGEDIDLSYRILKAGYKVHYLADTTIVHFKGESTKKGSLNYVKTFYSAMSLYVDKHHGGNNSLFGMLLKLGIWTRGGVSALSRLVKSGLPLALDFLLIFLGLYGFARLWAEHYFKDAAYYEESPLLWNIGFYALVWTGVAWLLGYYKKSKLPKRIQVVLVGLAVVLSVYALLDDQYRTSRIITLVGATISFLVFSITALFRNRSAKKETSKNILIVSKEETCEKIMQVLNNSSQAANVVGLIFPSDKSYDHTTYINNIDSLQEVSKVLKVDEVIFNTEDLSTKKVMQLMTQMPSNLSYKIAGDDSLAILGSKSKNTAGEIYNVDLRYNIDDEYSRHIKRIFDVVSSLLLLVLSPLLIVINKLKLKSVVGSILKVLIGDKTWISYNDRSSIKGLPVLNHGVFHIAISNRDYAREYTVWQDVTTLFLHLNRF